MRARFDCNAEPMVERGQNGTAIDAIDAEHWALTTDAGRRLLAEIAALRPEAIGPKDLARWRAGAGPEFVAAAVRLVSARRKAAEKFERGASMWADPVGVEQATSEPVARHKAARFAAARCAVDFCAGIGGDAVAIASALEPRPGANVGVLAVELDPGMCRRTAWNAAVHGVGDRILPVNARAERFLVPNGAWAHLDPDRRAADRSGRPRGRDLETYAPGPEVWASIAKRAEGGAIKLSPAADFERHFSGPEHEIELISLRGECKEATAWFGAAVTCRRRATRLPEGAVWTDRDGEGHERGPVPPAPLSDWMFDPDPALLRSGLLDGFARAHGLARVAAGADYLTSADRTISPFLNAFAVRDVAPLDLKHVRTMLKRWRVGTLEIKVRGAAIAPETLRARLRPDGDEPATLLVVGGAGPVRAVLAQRVKGTP